MSSTIPSVNDSGADIGLYLVKSGLLGAFCGILFFGAKALMHNGSNQTYNRYYKRLKYQVPEMKQEPALCELFVALQDNYSDRDLVSFRQALEACNAFVMIEQKLHNNLVLYKQLIATKSAKENDLAAGIIEPSTSIPSNREIKQLYSKIKQQRIMARNIWAEMGEALVRLRYNVYKNEKQLYDDTHKQGELYKIQIEEYKKLFRDWEDRKLKYEVSLISEDDDNYDVVRKNQIVFNEPPPQSPPQPTTITTQPLDTNKIIEIIDSINLKTMNKIKLNE